MHILQKNETKYIRKTTRVRNVEETKWQAKVYTTITLNELNGRLHTRICFEGIRLVKAMGFLR